MPVARSDQPLGRVGIGIDRGEPMFDGKVLVQPDRQPVNPVGEDNRLERVPRSCGGHGAERRPPGDDTLHSLRAPQEVRQFVERERGVRIVSQAGSAIDHVAKRLVPVRQLPWIREGHRLPASERDLKRRLRESALLIRWAKIPVLGSFHEGSSDSLFHGFSSPSTIPASIVPRCASIIARRVILHDSDHNRLRQAVGDLSPRRLLPARPPSYTVGSSRSWAEPLRSLLRRQMFGRGR